MKFALKFVFLISALFNFTLGLEQIENVVGALPEKKNEEKFWPTKCPNVPKLDILPGLGYDILRGRNMAPVASYTYKLCKTTLDGKYLIPDSVFVYPEKKSNVEVYSEIIDNYRNYTSVDSKSIQLQASYSGLFDLSGSFGYDYQTVKQKQIDDEAMTTRVKATYTIYKVGVSNPEIDPQLKSSFHDALTALKNDDTNKCDLLLELILRDYGTHLITGLDAGALITKEDFVLRSFTKNYAGDKHVIKAAASAGFFNTFKFGASYTTDTENNVYKLYTKSTTSSTVNSFGGTLFKPNMSTDSWIDSVQSNLVSVDKWGTPLDNVITPHNFPDVPLPHLLHLQSEFSQAVERYYTLNSHVGCMEYGSTNFDYTANVQKVCTASKNNYTLGGVFQTCDTISEFAGLVGDLCFKANLTQKNFATGDYTCPDNYTAVPLKTGSVPFQHQRCVDSYCYHWWFQKYCETSCQMVHSRAEYHSYYCAAIHGMQIPANSGMMFGGVFTSKNDNPLTKARTCPPLFTDVKILLDLHVCLSTDYEQANQYSMKFGGMFSCQTGNPLVESSSSRSSMFFNRMSLLPRAPAVDTTPKTCPHGFTQHTALIEDDCYVNYCVEAGSFRIHGDIPIVLPPFRNFTEIFSVKGMKNETNDKYNLKGKGSSSGIGFAGISIGIAICFGVGLVVLGIAVLWKHRRNYRGIPVAEITPEETERLIQSSSDETA